MDGVGDDENGVDHVGVKWAGFPPVQRQGGDSGWELQLQRQLQRQAPAPLWVELRHQHFT